MDKLLSMILEYVVDSREVPEELIYEFSGEVTRLIEGGDFEDISDEFWKLENYVELYWRGRKFDQEKSAIRIFQMGQLLTYTNMISRWLEKIQKEITLDEYARILSDKYLFFKSIHDEYGITHKELANKIQISISSLSQFVNRIKGNGFFISRSMGREKHYYLTDKGEKLLGIMRKENFYPERKFIKLLGALNNLNEVISDDFFYKRVLEKNNGFQTENVFITTYKFGRLGCESVLKISANMNVLEGNNEVEIWDRKSKKYNKIS